MKKTLVILPDPKPFIAVEPILKTQGIFLSYAQNLTEAIKQMQSANWDIVMISWNLPLIDVKKTYEFLDSKLDAMVVVFSEVDKPQVVKHFMASGIKRTIYPPLSGQGVFNRLNTLLKSRDHNNGDKSPMGIIAIDGSEVPPDIEWEAAQPGPGQLANGEKLWQGVSHGDESATYLYQGVEAPKWDAKKGWDLGGKSLLKVNNEARTAMGSVFGQPIQKKAKLTVLGADKKAPYHPPATNEQDGSALFHATLTAALEVIKGVFCDPSEVDAEVGKIAFTWVETGSLTGMVIVGDPSESQEALDLLEGLQGEVKKEAEIKKEKYELLINKAVVSIPSTNASMWMGRKTKYVYGVKSPTNKMVMAYMPIERDIEYALDETGQYYAIAVEKAFRVGTKTPCEFFVFMKKNEKFVRYIGKDQAITESTITKLTNNQITNVMIHKDDLELFVAYKSRHHLGIK